MLKHIQGHKTGCKNFTLSSLLGKEADLLLNFIFFIKVKSQFIVEKIFCIEQTSSTFYSVFWETLYQVVAFFTRYYKYTTYYLKVTWYYIFFLISWLLLFSALYMYFFLFVRFSIYFPSIILSVYSNSHLLGCFSDALYQEK